MGMLVFALQKWGIVLNDEEVEGLTFVNSFRVFLQIYCWRALVSVGLCSLCGRVHVE